MTTTTAPFKTPLGHEELRTRAHKLGQRHRTILFLIDGRRPLAEVLSLAQQAGSATSHFEDLLRLGLVDLPPDPTPPPREIPTLTDEANVSSVHMVVPDQAPVPDQLPEVPALTEEVPPPEVLPVPPKEEPEVPSAPPQPQVQAPNELPPQVPPSEPFEVHEAKDPTRTLPVLNEPISLAPVLATFAEAAPESTQESQDLPTPSADRDSADLLAHIRDLLIDALRLDAPVFSARTFMRVRGAQSKVELIDLVWEIEDHLSHKRRSRRELQSLQRARELLGLGNTLVKEDDSRPVSLDDE